MPDNVTVSKADLSLVLKDWGKDYAPAATQLAYRRIMAAVDETNDITEEDPPWRDFEIRMRKVYAKMRLKDIKQSDIVEVNRKDLLSVLREWGSDCKTDDADQAWWRLDEIAAASPEPAPAPTCAMCGGSGLVRQPVPCSLISCPNCKLKIRECLECSNEATNGLYCAEHAPGGVK